MIVLTIATDKNKYVQEFENSLKRLGYSYKLLGLGTKWEGFVTKMKLFTEELSKLPENEIVIICDSYDILFIQSPEYILNKYNQKARGKVVIGLENITPEFCNFSTICDKNIIKQCNINNPYFLNFNYPNSGFLMGPVSILKDIYKFMIVNKHKDDQFGLFKWIENNCNKCYFDYGIDFVFNYFIKTLSNKQLGVKLLNHQKKEILVSNSKYQSKPSCIHMPAHYLDFGFRSERIRNFLFPHRTRIKKIEYMNEMYFKTCKPEFAYFGYWWPFFIVLLFIIIITAYKLTT